MVVLHSHNSDACHPYPVQTPIFLTRHWLIGRLKDEALRVPHIHREEAAQITGKLMAMPGEASHGLQILRCTKLIEPSHNPPGIVWAEAARQVFEASELCGHPLVEEDDIQYVAPSSINGRG
jgi:hypothetical protein